MHPNIYVGKIEGSASYDKWYYEMIVDHLESVTHIVPHIRVGFANTEGYIPYPGGGEHWGSNGVGDDLYSYGFDGTNLWTGNWKTQTNFGFFCAATVRDGDLYNAPY